jgi:[protein-PII] uridylyltransferase
MSYESERAELLVVGRFHGLDLAAALAELTDEWLQQLFSDEVPVHAGVALVATGGYGRGELSPGSDLDLLLLHDDREDIAELADRLWYPIWDAGMKLGHAVRTVEHTEVLLGAREVDMATSLLSGRHLAGDAVLTARVVDMARQSWSTHDDEWLTELDRVTQRRHLGAGEVAFLLEPDLKDGRGGLRDVHCLQWARDAGVTIDEFDWERVSASYRVLLETRVELQRLTGKRSEVLLLEDQDAVAEALSVEDADVLMGQVASAARSIAYVSGEVWRRITREAVAESGSVAAGVRVIDGEVHLDGDPGSDPMLVLHAAVHAAENDLPIDRASLQRLAERQEPLPDPWPEGARVLFVQLLRQGQQAVPVIEALDFFEVWTRIVPEWAPNRNRPQRNVYHRFTVDRHLLEAAAQASRLSHRVQRPDLLVVGALFHDIGKGYPGDHTEVGMQLLASLARRMGFDDTDLEMLVRMVELHLLLPDVATRRDIEDEQTLRSVAGQVETVEFLELLAALTEADSLATGPTAWGTWKAKLVRVLTANTATFLAGGHAFGGGRRSFITPQLEELMSIGEVAVEGEDQRLTIVAPDRLGVFSRAAGVLALRGLAVLQADAYSSEDGMAVSVFHVAEPDSPIDWKRVRVDIEKALSGRLAIDARIAERSRVYRRRTALAAHQAETRVTFDDEAATDATVVEVQTEDRVGVLYHVTRVLADMALDIRYAKIQTLAHEVVDAFYVRGADGPQLGPGYRREIELAISHALSLVK